MSPGTVDDESRIHGDDTRPKSSLHCKTGGTDQLSFESNSLHPREGPAERAGTRSQKRKVEERTDDQTFEPKGEGDPYPFQSQEGRRRPFSRPGSVIGTKASRFIKIWVQVR